MADLELIVGVNSNATYQEILEYFADRPFSEGWLDLPEGTQKKLSMMACRILDDRDWIGVSETEEQVLAFPRKGTYYEPKLGRDVELSGVPGRIKLAQNELAEHLRKNPDLFEESGGVRSFRLDTLELHDIKAAPLIPSIVRRLIAPLINSANSLNVWWRAN